VRKEKHRSRNIENDPKRESLNIYMEKATESERNRPSEEVAEGKLRGKDQELEDTTKKAMDEEGRGRSKEKS